MSAGLYGPRYWPTWVGLGLLRLLQMLPLPLLVATGRGIGRLALALPLPWKHIARVNIGLCLPGLDAKAREALIRRHFESLGVGLLESALTWWSRDGRIEPRVEFSGLEHLEAARARGKGVILLTAHFTPMQIGARIINSRVPITVLYKPTKNPVIAHVSRAGFARRASRVITHDNVRAMITALRDNEVVWYATDQSYRKKGAQMIEFCGVPAATNVFTSRLASMTGATVLYYACERLPGARGWHASIQPVFTGEGDAVDDTRRYNACIEAQIHRVPEQYWWIHRRFKGLDASYPDYYAAPATGN